jgi:hypothetical protein
MARNNLLLLLFLILSVMASAQYEMTPLNSFARYLQLKTYSDSSVIYNDTYLPMLINSNETDAGIKRYQNRVMRFVRNKHFVELRDSTLTLFADPFINFSDSRHGDTSFTCNSRGLIFRGKLSENFYFMSAAVENQVYYPYYLQSYITEKRVIPGLGRYKGFKETGTDYAFAFGQIYWTPLKYLTVEAGHGKQFIGEGYRSLILSDFSSFYPFLKFTASFGRFSIAHMYTAFQGVRREDSRLLVYQRSHGSFTSLAFHFSHKFKLSLTESVIWQTYGDNYNNRFPAAFFIPVPLIKPMYYGLSNPNNIMLGLNASWRPTYSILLYGQYILDDFSQQHASDSMKIYNRNGYQAGIRVIEPFKIKNLFLLGEFNKVRPYTYSSSITRQSFMGMNEPLAHPLGAGFREIVLSGYYRYKSIYVSATYSKAITTRDVTGTNFGTSISKSDTTATPSSAITVEAIHLQITNFSAEAGYIINPRYNFTLSAGYRYRNYRDYTDFNTDLIYIRLSTQLINHYNDF